MKNISLFLLLLGCIWWTSCSDDDSDFETAINNNMFRFTPVSGGAMMYYNLSDPCVYKVKVTYVDEFGKPVYKIADYAADSLLLDGFYKQQRGVPLWVSFLNKNEKESKVLECTFDTDPSMLYACFESMKVEPSWTGLKLSYDLSGRAEGLLSVYFVGINPYTKLQDTIFLKNFPLKTGGDVKILNIDDSQRKSEYTVMVTSEDNRKRIIHKQIFAKVEGVEVVKLQPKEFHDPFGLSNEKPYDNTNYTRPGAKGRAYAIDGDTKGTTGMKYYRGGRTTPTYSFLAGPNALYRGNNKPFFILEMNEVVMPGELRLYCRLKDNGTRDRDFPSNYYECLPCNVQVYGWIGDADCDPSDQDQNEDKWEWLGSYEQDPYNDELSSNRWFMPNNKFMTALTSLAAFEMASPVFLSIEFPYSQETYKYFKLEFRDTYREFYNRWTNPNDYVTFQEVELYGKK